MKTLRAKVTIHLHAPALVTRYRAVKPGELFDIDDEQAAELLARDLVSPVAVEPKAVYPAPTAPVEDPTPVPAPLVVVAEPVPVPSPAPAPAPSKRRAAARAPAAPVAADAEDLI